MLKSNIAMTRCLFKIISPNNRKFQNSVFFPLSLTQYPFSSCLFILCNFWVEIKSLLVFFPPSQTA